MQLPKLHFSLLGVVGVYPEHQKNWVLEMNLDFPKHSMYAIYTYIGVVWGVNVGISYIAVPWSVWV